METTETRICQGCGEAFQARTWREATRTFCSPSCRLKKWNRERREKDGDKIRAYARDYHKKNRAKRVEEQRRYREAHKEEHLARAKKYYAEHREEIIEKNKKYHLANRDAHNAKTRLQHQKARIKLPWRGLMNAAKSRARQKKIPFTLTKEWAIARWTGRCEITGLPFKLGLTGTGPQAWSPSIDRIRPEIGYTQENCRFILLAVNIFKTTGTDEEMLVMAKAIVKNLLKSKG